MQGKTAQYLALLIFAAGAPLSLRAVDRFDLRPKPASREACRVESVLEVAGQLKVRRGDETTTLPMQATGKASYEEMSVSTTSADARRSLRNYTTIEARLKINDQATQPELRNSARLIVADWADGSLTLFAPGARLRQEELDLITAPGDSLLVDNLLPEQPVAVGDRWQHQPALLAALTGIEAVNSNTIESELKEADQDRAKCELGGTIQGASDGVATDIELKAKYTYDFKAHRVTWLALLVKENRSISHAAPGIEATSRLQLKIVPTAGPGAALTSALDLNLSPTLNALRMEYVARQGDALVDYDRRWTLMSDDDKGAVFRMIDRGELVAQCNLTPLAQLKDAEPTALSQFQADIQKALGDNFGQFVSASQNADDPNRLLYRVIVTGKTADLPVQWNYHLLTDRAGRQALAVFTLESELVERFGDADADFVAHLRFRNASPATAAKPATAKPANKTR